MKKIMTILAFLFLFLNVNALEKNNYSLTVSSKNFATVPRNAVRLPILNIQIYAKKNIALNKIYLKKNGLASWSAFGNIWAETDDFHRSLKSRVSSKNEVIINFSTPLKIDQGKSKNITIYVNLNFQNSGLSFSFDLQNIEIKTVNSREISKYYAYYRPRNFYNSSRVRRTISRSKSNFSYTNSRKSYVPGSKDVLFLQKRFNQKYNFRAEGIFIPLSSNKGSLEDFNDFRLYIDGNFAGSTNDFVERNGKTGLFFSDNFEAGKRSDLRIYGRISHNATSGSGLSFDFWNSDILDKEWAWQ